MSVGERPAPERPVAPAGAEGQRAEQAPATAPASRITVRRAHAPGRSRVEQAVMATLAVAGLALALTLWRTAPPLVAAGALGLGVACLADLLLVGPFVHRFVAESERLRAALACPYCRDALPEDQAVACDRKGCGAFYHAECWGEVRAGYGGCAIYGCGCTTGHAVGRFALRRHVLRLVMAAVFFTPTVVRRLQETERMTVRELWRQAQAYQQGVTGSEWRTCLMAVVNLVLSFVTCFGGGMAIAFAWWKLGLPKLPEQVLIPLALLLITVPPALFMRLPLGLHFGLGFARLVGRVFRDELAALGRADQGTFLARLAGGAGKKAD